MTEKIGGLSFEEGLKSITQGTRISSHTGMATDGLRYVSLSCADNQQDRRKLGVMEGTIDDLIMSYYGHLVDVWKAEPIQTVNSHTVRRLFEPYII